MNKVDRRKTRELVDLEKYIVEAKNHEMNLMIFKEIDKSKQNSLWYGGMLARVIKDNILIEISACGDVLAALYEEAGDKEHPLVFVNDKLNDGLFAECMGKYIQNDEELLALLFGQEVNGRVLTLDSGNWFEFSAFDLEKKEYVGPDMIENVIEQENITDIFSIEVLEELFRSVLDYQEEELKAIEEMEKETKNMGTELEITLAKEFGRLSKIIKETTWLKDASVQELADELRSRSEVVAVQVWQEADLEEALKLASYRPTPEHIDVVANDARKVLEDCSHGWEVLDSAISWHRDSLAALETKEESQEKRRQNSCSLNNRRER